MYNTAGKTDMAKNLKVVLKVLHLWSTTKAEVVRAYTDRRSTRKIQVTLSKEINNLDTLGVIWAYLV